MGIERPGCGLSTAPHSAGWLATAAAADAAGPAGDGGGCKPPPLRTRDGRGGGSAALAYGTLLTLRPFGVIEGSGGGVGGTAAAHAAVPHAPAPN